MPIDLVTYFLKSKDAHTHQLAEAAVAAMDKKALEAVTPLTTKTLAVATTAAAASSSSTSAAMAASMPTGNNGNKDIKSLEKSI